MSLKDNVVAAAPTIADDPLERWRVGFEDMFAKYTIVAMCSWLGMLSSGYYEWRTRAESATTRRRAPLSLLVQRAFEESEESYGQRRIHAQLLRWGQ